MRYMTNVSHFIVCVDKLLNHILNCKKFYTHILFYDETVNHVNRTYIGSLLMGHGYAETVLEKLKETLKDLNYTNELM